MKTLLGHLTQFSTLQSQGEVLCTQGLAFLLQNPGTATVFAAALGRWSAAAVPAGLSWRAEAYQIEDAGRPDLEGCTPDGTPVVKVEAKLGAGLSPAQLRSYALNLVLRSGGGILLVLVPAHRLAEAAFTVAEAFGISGDAPWRSDSFPGVTVTVMSWEKLFLDLGAAGSSPDSVLSLREMYEAITGYVIKPLAGPEALQRWMDRERDFIELVDRSTRCLQQDHGCWMGPFGQETTVDDLGEKLYRYYRRYLCRPVQGGRQPFFSIGVRPPFEGWETPVWLRFNRTTPLFTQIRDRLMASDLSSRVILSAGHAWLPLDVPFESDEETMVSSLVRQTLPVIDVAYHDLGS